MTHANSRASAAEALLEVARDRVAALASGSDPNLRDLLKASATAKRDDIGIMLRLIRHQDQNVRKTCDALTSMQPAMIAKLLDYFTAARPTLTRTRRGSMDFDNELDRDRDFDEMWFHHSAQLVTMRNISPMRASATSLALLRRVFGEDQAFNSWLIRKRLLSSERE